MEHRVKIWALYGPPLIGLFPLKWAAQFICVDVLHSRRIVLQNYEQEQWRKPLHHRRPPLSTSLQKTKIL